MNYNNLIEAKEDKQLINETIDYMLHSPETSKELLMAGNGSKTAKKKVMVKAEGLLKDRKLENYHIDRILENLEKFLWGYYILEPFIESEIISDIRVMDYDKIAVCCNGVYKMSTVSFSDRNEYESFMQSVAMTNQISLADINALQVATDKKSNQDWILRIAIATGYINSGNTYFMHIRKHPKKKRSFENLMDLGMIPKEMAGYLKGRIDKGLLVAGQTGSGKTHFINAMIELIPPNLPGICLQESEELFSNNSESLMTFLHVVVKKGEGKIQYNLEELSKFGLLTSNKYFIIGEIKGSEAECFANACYTGSVCWTTVHAQNSTEAIDKLCDYVIRATGYDIRFVKKMLKSLETIVFMENYKISEISEIKEFDESSGQIIYKTVYRRGGAEK